MRNTQKQTSYVDSTDEKSFTLYLISMVLIRCSCVELAAEHLNEGRLTTMTAEDLCKEGLWERLSPAERARYEAHIAYLVEQELLPLVRVSAMGALNEYQYQPGLMHVLYEDDDEAEEECNRVCFDHFSSCA